MLCPQNSAGHPISGRPHLAPGAFLEVQGPQVSVQDCHQSASHWAASTLYPSSVPHFQSHPNPVAWGSCVQPGPGVPVCVWVAQLRPEKLGILARELPRAGVRLVSASPGGGRGNELGPSTPEAPRRVAGPARRKKRQEKGSEQEEAERGSWRRRPGRLSQEWPLLGAGSPGPGAPGWWGKQTSGSGCGLGMGREQDPGTPFLLPSRWARPGSGESRA